MSNPNENEASSTPVLEDDGDGGSGFTLHQFFSRSFKGHFIAKFWNGSMETPQLEFNVGQTKWKFIIKFSLMNMNFFLTSVNDEALFCKIFLQLQFEGKNLYEGNWHMDVEARVTNQRSHPCPYEYSRKEGTLAMRITIDVHRPSDKAVIPGLVSTITPLLNGYKETLASGAYCDMTFVVNGESIPAHKAFVCARSPVFRKMLESGMSESRESVVKIVDCETSIFKELLLFLYAGKVRPGPLREHAIDFLALSTKYDLPDLMALSSAKLVQQLTPENTCQTLVEADKYSAAELKQSVLNFAVANYGDVICCPDFADFGTNHPALHLAITLAYAKHLSAEAANKKRKR